jgi:hypothetical protein
LEHYLLADMVSYITFLNVLIYGVNLFIEKS